MDQDPTWVLLLHLQRASSGEHANAYSRFMLTYFKLHLARSSATGAKGSQWHVASSRGVVGIQSPFGDRHDKPGSD